MTEVKPLRLAQAYGLAALAFLALDSCWLLSTSQLLYKPALGALMRDDIAWLPAVLFYGLYVAGIVVLAVLPGLQQSRWQAALWRGAVLGLVAYATYDLTNQATLVGWPLRVTLLDLCWGTFATAVSAGLTCRLTTQTT